MRLYVSKTKLYDNNEYKESIIVGISYIGDASDSTDSARIEHLERENIITSYEARINQTKLGFHITAFINLEIIPTQKDEFYPFIKACPNVIECNCVTGDFSMLIKVAFPDTMKLDKFIGKLQKFGRTSTQIVFSTPVENRGINVSDIAFNAG